MPTGTTVTMRLPRSEAAGVVRAKEALFDSLAHERRAPEDKPEPTTPSAKRKASAGRCVWSRPETPKTGRKGSKRRQRYLNLKYLLDLRVEVDDEEADRSYADSKNTYFTSLLDSPSTYEKWCNFTQRPDEQQRQFISQSDARARPTHVSPLHSKTMAAMLTPEYCFARVDRRIRLAFKTTHVPLGTVEVLEGQVVGVFEEDPDLVVVMVVDCPYLRCLLHGLCQYYGLVSYSETNMDGVRQTFVENRADTFVPPPVRLSAYLQLLDRKDPPCAHPTCAPAAADQAVPVAPSH